MSEVSNGMDSFTLSNTPQVGARIAELDLKEGDEFLAEIEVSPAKIFVNGVNADSLRGTIVGIEQE